MKQIALAIIAFFIMVSFYSVATSFQENNTSTLQEANITNVQVVQTNKKNVIQNTSVGPVTAKVKKTNKQSIAQKTMGKKTFHVTRKSKRQFIEKTITAVQKVKAKLDAEFDFVYKMSQKEGYTKEENAHLQRLKKSYRVKGIPCLLRRLKTHPTSIVVAQAALETGWGSSRFYREANNIFGVWSFNKNEPRLAAGVKRNGKHTIYVKKFKTLDQSIEAYYRMMATNRHYKKLRSIRLHTDNPFEIIPFLDHYSELRHQYVKRLYYVMKANKFYELDNPQFQPPGWSNIKAADPKYLLAKKPKPAAKIAGKCKKDIVDVNSADDNSSSHAEDLTIIKKEKVLESNLTISK